MEIKIVKNFNRGNILTGISKSAFYTKTNASDSRTTSTWQYQRIFFYKNE